MSNEKGMMLPRIVYLMSVHGGLITGSQAKRMAGENIESDSSDWDVLVPFQNWQTIAMLIPSDAKPNKFGGWRFEDDKGVEIDVWPGDPMTYLRECKTKYGGAVYVVDYIRNMIFSSAVRDIANDGAQ